MDVGSSPPRYSRISTRRFAYWFSVFTSLLLFFTVTMLWGRRLAGAFERPLTPAMMVLAGLVLLVLTVGLRLPLFMRDPHRPAWAGPALLYANSAILILFATLVTNPNRQPWWSWLLLWVAFISCEVIVYWWPLFEQSANTPGSGVARLEAGSMPEFSDSVTQQFTRSHDGDIGEIIQGRVRARFDAGQRTGHVHLAFCPAFSRPPHVEVESAAGPAAQLQPALVVPHGARIDVRLDRSPESATEILLDVFVCEGNE